MQPIISFIKRSLESVDDAHGGILLQQLCANGVHQVRLSHTDAAVDEQRVVAAGGLFRDRAAAAMRELVAGAHHELSKRKR